MGSCTLPTMGKEAKGQRGGHEGNGVCPLGDRLKQIGLAEKPESQLESRCHHAMGIAPGGPMEQLGPRQCNKEPALDSSKPRQHRPS